MVWGLEKLWPSGTSSSPQNATTNPGAAAASSTASTTEPSSSRAPLVTATVSADRAQSPSPSLTSLSSTTTLSPSLQQQLESSAPDASSQSFFSSRSTKQFTLFAAGATFFLLSSRLTRRQLSKRNPTPVSSPPTFRPSNSTMDISVNGPIEAVEALSIATINVLSFSMMTTGGLLWAFDISSIDDLRRKIRGGLGVDGTGRDEGALEREFEEWLATTIERKREREGGKKGVTEVVNQDEQVRRWRDERGRERSL